MRCRRLELVPPSAGGSPSAVGALAAEIRGHVPDGESVTAAVAEILAAVRERGMDAVVEYERRFNPPPVADGALSPAAADGDPELRRALKHAAANVAAVARAAMVEDRTVRLPAGHTVTLRSAPVRSAAVYVPGGRAPYPSTVVMGVVTARVAGVERIVVATPPGRDGRLQPAIVAACEVLGVEEIFPFGGAQGVAALAYGADGPPVDVIVGPGNLYVQEAKRQLSDRIGIDGFAGPSDLVVVCDPGTHLEPVALDLLAQSEHGPGTLCVACSPDGGLLDGLERRLAAEPDTGAAVALVLTHDIPAAAALATAIAPEHLELIGPESEGQQVTAACVFIGPASATAFGDYLAGSNHTLPTGGSARFASGLGPWHFRRRFSEVRMTPAAAGVLAGPGATIARAEGFELHARSMEERVGENGRS